MTNKEITKLENEKMKYKKYCEFCGHTISFYAFEGDKKICSHCGRYNYRNNLVKFKDKLNKSLMKFEKKFGGKNERRNNNYKRRFGFVVR